MADITAEWFSAGIVRLAFLAAVKWDDRGIEAVVKIAYVHCGDGWFWFVQDRVPKRLDLRLGLFYHKDSQLPNFDNQNNSFLLQ